MLWHLTAAFLYGEMLFVVALLLPFISTRSWSRLFKSRIAQKIAINSSFYFNLFLVMLVCVLFEALRNVWTQREAYNALKRHPHEMRPETESLYLMRMFRAQRNLYISGFSLFVWFVLQRLIRLISDHAQMSASQEASLKQAHSATAVAERLINRSNPSDSETSEASRESVNELKEKLAQLQKKYESEQEVHKQTANNLEALKKQSLQTNAEYDRVSQECQKLQYRIQLLEGNSSSKKSD